MEEKQSESQTEKKANKKFKKPKFEEFQVENNTNDTYDTVVRSGKSLTKENSKAGFEEVPQGNNNFFCYFFKFLIITKYFNLI